MCRRLVSLSAAIVLMAGVCAHAAIRTFDNDGGDNRWDLADNWSNNTIPGTGDTARVTGPAHALIDDAVDAQVSKIQVGWLKADGTDGDSGELQMTGGALTWTAASDIGLRHTGLFSLGGGAVNGSHDLYVGDEVGGAGTFTATGGSLTLYHDSNLRNLIFGTAGGQGAGNISNFTLSVNGDLYMGDGAGSTGTLSLTDSTVTVGDDFRTAVGEGVGSTTVTNTAIDVQSDFRVGAGGGNGVFTFNSGIITTKGAADIGRGLDSVGEFTMNDGTLNVGNNTTNALRFGYDGGTGTGTINGGTVNVSGNLVVGNNYAGDPPVAGNGTLNVTGAVINVGDGLSTHEFSIGKNLGIGYVNMSGGVVNVVSGDMRIGETAYSETEPIEAFPGTGHVRMTGGIISISDANSLQIGLNDSTGLLELIDGIINTGNIEIGDPGSGGILDIYNGALIVNGDKTDVIADYIDRSLIIAFGGADDAEVLFDFDISNAGMTTVTAVPEPMTIALLGLGGLALRRRKHWA